MTVAPGTRIGPYQITAPLGTGGMGEVYRARDTRLDRDVALKLLGASAENGGAARLQREARLASAINHPHVVALYDVGESDGRPYLVTELLEGEPLRARLLRGPLPVGQAIAVATQIARGLQAAHAKGIVHRDLKPENVFITRGEQVKILDFGIAKQLEPERTLEHAQPAAATLTAAGALLGTPAYMSPEQLSGLPVDARTDLFALGCVLHEMLAGARPFAGRTPAELSAAILHEPPAPLSDALAPALRELVEHCLQKRAADRPDSARAVEEALLALDGTALGAEGQVSRRLARNPLLRALGAFAIFAFALLQVIEPVMHGLHLPDSLLTAVVVALALGFPATLAVAWAWQLARRRQGRGRIVSLRMLPALAGVLIAWVAVGYFAWRMSGAHGAGEVAPVAPPASALPQRTNLPPDAPAQPRPPESTQASIAVLPFVDLSPARDRQYFADGVAEEILTALAQVPDLKVIGRTSSFAFRGQAGDLRSIGRALDVGHVLEGSVRTEGKRVRVTAQLVRTSDGGQIWSKRYDSKLSGIFRLQEQIAQSVVAALELKLLAGARAGAGTETRSPEAYRLYLLGRQQMALGTSAGFRAAVGAFEGAVREDAEFAPALVWLGAALWSGDQIGAGNSTATNARVMELVNRAVQLAPRYAGAWAGRCLARSFLTWRWVEALSDCRRALELSPGDAIAQTYYGQLLGKMGRNAEALAELERAARADPLNTITLRWLGVFQAAGGQREAARATFARGLQAAPDNAYLIRELALTWIEDGQGQKALEAFERSSVDWIREMGRAMAYRLLGQEEKSLAAMRALEGVSGVFYQLAQVHALRGETDQAFRALERAWTGEDPALHFILFDPLLAPLRRDPRYAAMLQRVGLRAQ